MCLFSCRESCDSSAGTFFQPRAQLLQLPLATNKNRQYAVLQFFRAAKATKYKTIPRGTIQYNIGSTRPKQPPSGEKGSSSSKRDTKYVTTRHRLRVVALVQPLPATDNTSRRFDVYRVTELGIICFDQDFRAQDKRVPSLYPSTRISVLFCFWTTKCSLVPIGYGTRFESSRLT